MIRMAATATPPTSRKLAPLGIGRGTTSTAKKDPRSERKRSTSADDGFGQRVQTPTARPADSESATAMAGISCLSRGVLRIYPPTPLQEPVHGVAVYAPKQSIGQLSVDLLVSDAVQFLDRFLV